MMHSSAPGQTGLRAGLVMQDTQILDLAQALTSCLTRAGEHCFSVHWLMHPEKGGGADELRQT